MSIHKRGKAMAKRILKRNGQLGSVQRVTSSGGGPASLSAGTDTTETHACRLVLFPVNQRDVDGELVKAGDWRAIVEAIDDFIPTTTDKLVCSEGDLTIVDAGKFSPAGTVTHYDMLVRK